jgi:hypothetical protein
VLRDDDGHVADGFSASGLTLAVDGGSASAPVRVAPGLYRFAVTTPAGTGGRELTVTLRFEGRTLVSERVPIAVDHALARAVPSAFGGCGVAGSRSGDPGEWFLGWVLVIVGGVRWRLNGRTGNEDV